MEAIAAALTLNATSGDDVMFNGTASDVQITTQEPPMLKKIHDLLIIVLLVTVMFAMGCSITWKQVRKQTTSTCTA